MAEKRVPLSTKILYRLPHSKAAYNIWGAKLEFLWFDFEVILPLKESHPASTPGLVCLAHRSVKKDQLR